jgi:hypothetical protein
MAHLIEEQGRVIDELREERQRAQKANGSISCNP